MFVFKIKDDADSIEATATGSLLFLGALVTFSTGETNHYLVNVPIAVVLMLASLFINTILLKYKIDKLLLMSIAAILVLIATHSIVFAVMLMLFAFVIKGSYIQPQVTIDKKGVSIKKMFRNQHHAWDNFNNIVLKDNLLSLDFKNNKLLQLDIDESTAADENAFNKFCNSQMTL